MKKIIITGVNGYIGNHLVKKILNEQNYYIYGVARSKAKLSHRHYTHIMADLSERGWTHAISDKADIVIHLAQSKRYRHFPDGAEDMVRINIDTTFELLEWSRKAHVKQFLFASTGNVYKPNKELLKETDPCEPQSMYAATKFSAEQLVSQYRSFYQTIIMRIFGVYGPGQKDMLIPSMIERVQTCQEIILAQGAGIYLTPLYISDCVKMIVRLVQSHTLSQHEVVNLAGSEITHLGKIVTVISECLKHPPNVRITNEEPKYLQGSNEKVLRLIGVKLQSSIERDIPKIIEE